MSAGTHPAPMELAALLTSKICHDLISPVGAINNGLEVMADKNNADMHDFALDLVNKSAAQASSKLQFCRMAYGAGSSAGSEIDLGEAGAVARGFVESERTKLIWNAPAARWPRTRSSCCSTSSPSPTRSSRAAARSSSMSTIRPGPSK